MTDFDDHFASASGNITQNNVFFGEVLKMSANATADWIDLASPPPPAAPVGSVDIEGNTTSQIFGARFNVAFNQTMQTTTANGGTYILADTLSPPEAPVTLVETYWATYVPASGPDFTSGLLIGMATTSGNVNIGGGATGFTSVSINNQVVTGPSSGQFTNGNTTTAYSISSGTFMFTITTVFPNGVPSATSSNPPIGVNFGFNQGVQHWLTHNAGAAASSGTTSLTTHYEARFFA